MKKMFNIVILGKFKLIPQCDTIILDWFYRVLEELEFSNTAGANTKGYISSGIQFDSFLSLYILDIWSSHCTLMGLLNGAGACLQW
jgi:hypothetical protein